MFDVHVLRLSLFALALLLVVVALLWGVVATLRGSKKPKPEEARGPFTRPTQPADPSTLRYNPPDHYHMRSGTIAETPIRRTTPIQTNLLPGDLLPGDLTRSMNEMSRSLLHGLSGGGPLAPGVQVRVVHTIETTQVPSQQTTPSKGAKEPEPEVQRKNRYHRDPVI